MKIISKQKDYYDFVVGHDSDPRKVYVRKEEVLEKEVGKELSYALLHSRYFLGEVWFCDKLYPYVRDWKEDTFWYDYYQIPPAVKEAINPRIVSRYGRTFDRQADAFSCAYYRHMSLEGHFDIELDKRDQHRNWWYSTHFRKIKVKLNTKYSTPVLFSCYRDGQYPDCLRIKNGLLKEVKFGQVMTPAQAYMALYNWIPYQEPKMPDDPTDMSRFENKGFSKKTSFRGK